MKTTRSNTDKILRSGLLTPGLLALANGMTCGALEPNDLFAIDAGPVVIQPKLQVSYQYDDNIFYSRDETAVADSLIVVSPSIEFRLGRPEASNLVDLVYRFTSYNYFENSDQNGLIHSLNSSAVLRGDRLSSETSVGFEYLDTILGGYEYFTEGGSVAVGKMERFRLDLEERVAYSFTDRTEAYVRGTFELIDYLQDTNLYDRNAWRVFPGFSYRATSKLWVFGEAFYGQMASNPNSLPAPLPTLPKFPYREGVGGFLGVRGPVSDRISGQVKVGYEHNSSSAADSDFGTPIADVSLTWRATDRLTAALSYRRNLSISASAANTISVADYGDASLRWVTGTAHPLTVTLGGGAGVRSYEGADSSQTYYRAHLDATYAIKRWLAVGAGYEFQASDRESTVGSADTSYTDNRVTVFVSLGY